MKRKDGSSLSSSNNKKNNNQQILSTAIKLNHHLQELILKDNELGKNSDKDSTFWKLELICEEFKNNKNYHIIRFKEKKEKIISIIIQ